MSWGLLWTDKCFLFVLTIAVIVMIKNSQRLHVKRAWQSMVHQPVAVCAGIILLFFLLIATLDSLRFQNEQSSGSITALDYLLSPLDSVDESTYSAPLALNLYAAEMMVVGGVTKQVYARLTYPPLSIETDQQKWQWVGGVLFKAFCLSGFFTMLLGLVAKHFSIPKSTFWSGLITLGVCIFLTLATYGLSRKLHILGTGKIGQDIFYYAIKSIRTSLIIGLLTTLFMLPLALFLGVTAGYFGGWIDDIVQYIYTTLSSIPGVLLITASVLSMQTYIANHPDQFNTLASSADARLFALCLILGVTSWTSLCRLLRAEALKLREIDYVLAARALGSGPFKIMTKHLLPNVMHIVLMTLVLDFSYLVLAESVLSYVGVGVSPMTMSWGNMINAARLELAREPIVWWPMFSAFIFMFVLVLASNLLADAVRDAFDPQKQRS